MVEYRGKPLNRVFFALADPTRRAILLHVARGEARVTSLAAGFTISLAAVSKHIRVLEEAGLLKRTKQGREYHLRLVPEPLRDATDWTSQFSRFWIEHLDRIKQLAESKARGRVRK